MKSKLEKVLISFILITTIVNLEAAENQYPKTVKLVARSIDNNIEEPKVNKSSIDYHNNSVIKKIIKKDFSISSYPKIQSWNKDMTLIRISNRLYDANTLVESSLTRDYYSNSAAAKGLCSRSSDYFRWSNVEPTIFYVLNSSRNFIKATITDNKINCSNSIESFRDYEVIHMGPYEGNIDYNDKYVIFIAKKRNNEDVYLILFDIEEEKRVWTKKLENNKWIKSKGKWKLSSIDWVSVSPSGHYIVLNESHVNGAEGGMFRYDINFENRVRLQYMRHEKLLSQGGHGDMGYDIDGNEVLVEFIGGLGVYQFSLDNPTEIGKNILSPYGGGHISCRNSERKGWCYITTREKNYRHIFALKIDGSKDETVQEFSQSHMSENIRKVFGSPSPDGKKVIFNSDWEKGDENKVDTFVSFTL